MTKNIKILSGFSIKDNLVLLWGLFLDFFYKRIPKNLFLIKNTYDFIFLSGGDFKRIKEESIISYNNQKFILRLKGSDFLVFNQIVINKGIEALIVKIQDLNKNDINIMDCGANIGLSTLLLKKAFPSSRIISIEPDLKNFEQLTKNIQLNSLSKITPLQMGVWYEETHLGIDSSFRDGQDWSISLRKSENESDNFIKVDTIERIMKMNHWDSVDVLKIDIEGAEFLLFQNLNNWINVFKTVRVISIEPHHEAGQAQEIIKTLLQHGFLIESHQELLIGVKA